MTIILPAKVTAGEEVLVISRAESRAIQDCQELFSCKSVKLFDLFNKYKWLQKKLEYVGLEMTFNARWRRQANMSYSFRLIADSK